MFREILSKFDLRDRGKIGFLMTLARITPKNVCLNLFGGEHFH